MSHGDVLYDDATTDFLEAMWGDGYLSPGGPEEVARVLDGLDLRGRTVLDIGCGAGGITVALARDYGAAKVIGIDVEAPVCAKARARVAAAGLADRIEIRAGAAGTVSVCRRQRRPGVQQGLDRPHPGQGGPGARGVPRAAAGRLVRGLGLADRPRRPALAGDGPLHRLRGARLRHGVARHLPGGPGGGGLRRRRSGEPQSLVSRGRHGPSSTACAGRSATRARAILGEAETVRQIRTWEAMLVVLATGEHCPHHFRGRKPA